MAGALAERVFVDKLVNVGFTDIAVPHREPFGLADAARYHALFTPEVVELMERVLTPEQQAEVAVSVRLTARKPAA